MKTICNFIICCCCCLFCIEPAWACHPLLKCVQDNTDGVKSDGTQTANFSFVGGESIPVGSRNYFTPIPQNRGQGTIPVSQTLGKWLFASNSSVPGKEVLPLSFPINTTLAWSLNGSTVTASSINPKDFVTTTALSDSADSNGTPLKCATITLKPTGLCSQKVGIASYSVMTNPDDLVSQILFDSATTVLLPNTSQKLCVKVPSCATQVDVFYGDTIKKFTNTPNVRYANTGYNGTSRLLTALNTPVNSQTVCKVDCKGVFQGAAVVDKCGVCGGDDSTCKDCAGVPNGTKKVDKCGVCGGDDSTCKDCFGTVKGSKKYDACEVCGGDDSTCKDCAGVPNGTKQIDLCGKCGGQNNTCLDCAGVPNGTSSVDLCGKCLAASDSTRDLSCTDCAGTPNGSAKPDSCGMCNGSNSCLDCAGIPNGGTLVDECGVCGGNGQTCAPKCENVTLKLNKSELLKAASHLQQQVTTYGNQAMKCARGVKGKHTVNIKTAKKDLAIYIQLLNSLNLTVEVCDGDCALAGNELTIAKMRVVAKQLFNLSSYAQKDASFRCKTKNKGIKATKPLYDELDQNILDCPNKACR